jgi:histidine ammonia-lyase
MSYNYLPLDKQHTSFKQIKNYLKFEQHISITFFAHDKIITCRNYLNEKLRNSDKKYYGINTGFGYLQNIEINKEDTTTLQKNLLLSHACGLGEEVPSVITKLMLLLKVKSLSYGYSGVQIDTVNRLMDMHNYSVLPVVYKQGSLGASGDLVPLSHLALPLIGEGEVTFENKKTPSVDALKKLDWPTINLQSKEGIALINGTQFMTAYGLHNCVVAEKLIQWANIIASISIDAFNASKEPFNENIHRIRNQKGQQIVAKQILDLLSDSEINNEEKKQVQDPYSFRCIPQVHGASYDVLQQSITTFVNELNAVTDNPNIFVEEDLILSGGNFHGQGLAYAADFLAIALAEIGSISERRTFQLLSGQRELPLFLNANPGLNSGLMIPQYVAAGLVSENKQLCTPASIDSIPSSNNQEDHVSMGANAAVKCATVLDNVAKILAIELLTATQALDFKKQQKTSSYLQQIIIDYRAVVSFNDADRILHNDIIKTIEFIKNYNFAPTPNL